MFVRLIVLFFCLLTSLSCGDTGPKTGKAEGESFLRCAYPVDDGQKERFELSPLRVERDGLNVVVQGIERGLIVFGILSGLREPSDATLKNIDYFLKQFKDAGVQSILVAGDLGFRQEQIEATLQRLSRAPVPILLIPGAQESFDLFRKAIDNQRRTSPQLLDMTKVRRVTVGNVSVVSIPGYFKPFYLSAGERGCSYTESDLEKLSDLFKNKGVTFVLSHSPPRSVGEWAVDMGGGGVNTGDLALKRVLQRADVQFGVFGHVYESGGHATGSDGRSPLASGIWQTSLFLQAGSAEAMPLTLVGGGRSAGMAQIVEISGKRARFRTVYAKN